MGCSMAGPRTRPRWRRAFEAMDSMFDVLAAGLLQLRLDAGRRGRRQHSAWWRRPSPRRRFRPASTAEAGAPQQPAGAGHGGDRTAREARSRGPGRSGGPGARGDLHRGRRPGCRRRGARIHGAHDRRPRPRPGAGTGSKAFPQPCAPSTCCARWRVSPPPRPPALLAAHGGPRAAGWTPEAVRELFRQALCSLASQLIHATAGTVRQGLGTRD